VSDSGSDSTPVKMTVKALVMDPVSNMPVVILEQADQSAFLPIWIGVCEANSIALELEGVSTPRPMTHDLIGSVIAELGYSVKHICIHSLDESVFMASIFLSDDDGKVHEVDSRPSDALAVALRAKADVLVHPDVLERALIAETSREEAIRLILEKMRPEDMGEYEM
jgi:bifunctional DNase/RNase